MNSETFSKIKNAVNAASEFLNGELAKSYGSYKGTVSLVFEQIGNVVLVDIINFDGTGRMKNWAIIDTVDMVLMDPKTFFDPCGSVDELYNEAAVIRWNLNVK